MAATDVKLTAYASDGSRISLRNHLPGENPWQLEVTQVHGNQIAGACMNYSDLVNLYNLLGSALVSSGYQLGGRR